MHISSIFESLNIPVSYTQNGNSFFFTVEDVSYIIHTDSAIVNGVTCKTLGFESSKTGSDAPLNTSHQHTNNVFSTILVIIKKHILPCDIVFIKPDDISVEILDQKIKLYQAIASRMKISGIFSDVGSVILEPYNIKVIYGIPTFSIVSLTETQIKQLAVEYGINKFRRIQP